MVTAWLYLKKPDATMALNGALAGLVGITAGCANVTPGSSIIIGLIAGVLVVFSVLFFDRIRHRRPGGRHLGPRRLRRLGHAGRRPLQRRGRDASPSSVSS